MRRFPPLQLQDCPTSDMDSATYRNVVFLSVRTATVARSRKVESANDSATPWLPQGWKLEPVQTTKVGLPEVNISSSHLCGLLLSAQVSKAGVAGRFARLNRLIHRCPCSRLTHAPWL